MNRKLRILKVLAASLALGLIIPTVCAALTVDVPPVADSWVTSKGPNVNYGGAINIYVLASATDTRHSFLKFDLNGVVPAGSEVTDISLYLYARTVTQAGSVEVRQVVDDSWTELGITWNNAPAAGSVLDTQSVAVGSGYWVHWDLLANGSSWLADEADKIISVMVQIPTEPDPGNLQFASREYANTALRPYLEIQYSQIPVPPSLLLLGSGLLALAVIRRRKLS